MTETEPVVENVMPATALLLNRAIEKQRNGDYINAEELYREVLSRAPENIVAMHHLAVLLMDSNLPQQAIPLLSRAVELDSNNSSLYYNLGLAYQSSNELQAAVHNYKLAIELNESFSQAYNNLGIVYQHMGKIELANFYLEKAFSTDPNCVEAYYNFSQTHKFTTADASLINTIEKLIPRNNESKPALIKTHFTLGKIFDDLNKYETAFEHYQQANSLKFQGFNAEALEKYVDNIITTYRKEVVETLASSIEPPKKRFIFIIGMPRSGTTLVEQIIASHPLVQSGGEIGFVGDIIDELPELIDYQLPYPQCITLFNEKMFSQLAQKFVIYLNNLGGNFLHVTDKSPVNFLHLGLIKILFPQSTIIHVSRNPIATCLSCYFQNFEKQHQYSYDLKTLGQFYKTYLKMTNHWNAIFRNEIISVSYEDIVSHPRQTMMNLISECGLNWDDACFEFYNENNIVNSASKWQTRQPIYNTSIEKWKNYQKFIRPLIEEIEDI